MERPNFPPPTDRPKPTDFEEFVPWACMQFEIEVPVQCITVSLPVPAHARGRSRLTSKSKKSALTVHDFASGIGVNDDTSHSTTAFLKNTFGNDNDSITITTTYDYLHNLVQIKIDKKKVVPRTLLKIIAYIVQFHPTLTTVTANRGIDEYSIHEISKFLPISNITDICLDGTLMKNPNYYLLLQIASNLSCFSLSKCQITDETVQLIADCLVFSRPAAKTLTFLNLSSNRITDDGALYLSEALKSNRQLAYLNLADNHITDTGASYIFDTMLEFPIINEELVKYHIRYKQYMDKKLELVSQFLEEFKEEEKKKGIRKKIGSKVKEDLPEGSLRAPSKAALKGEKPIKAITETKTIINMYQIFLEKAETLALQALGDFVDPYKKSISRDGITFCLGSNSLTCLNLAYNSLSYCSLRKLLLVLRYQSIHFLSQQKPRGLFKVVLEGNLLPKHCVEFVKITNLLAQSLECQQISMTKKKPGAK